MQSSETPTSPNKQTKTVLLIRIFYDNFCCLTIYYYYVLDIGVVYYTTELSADLATVLNC